MHATHRLWQTGILLLALVAPAWAQEGVRWHTDLEQAQRLAAQTNRLVLVHFWAEWCQPCARLDREVFNQAQVGTSLDANFVPVKLNADQFAATARSYGVDSLPTDVVITPDGKSIAKFNSPMTAETYLSRANNLAAAHRLQHGGAQVAQAASPAATGFATPTAGYTPPTDPYANATAGNNPYAAPPVNSATAASNPYAAGNNYGQPAGATPPAMQPQAGPYTANPYAAAPQNADPYAAAPQSADPYANPAPSDPYSAPAPSLASNPYTAPTAPADRYGVTPPASNGYGAPADRYSAGGPSPAPTAQAPQGAGVDQYGTPVQAANPYMNPAAPNYANQATNPYAPAANDPYAPQAGYQQPATAPAQDVAAQQPAQPAVNQDLGLEGFCSVTLTEGQRWVQGDRRWGAIHRGRTYLFTGPEQQQRFLANPDLYAPAMSGNDPVLALEQGQNVQGMRKHGVYYRDRIYLFSNEASLARFSQNPEHFADGVRQAMQAPPAGTLPPR